MQLQKKYLLPVVALAVIVSVFSIGSVAQADMANSQESLIQKLVSRFNLNEAEVKQVVGEHRDQMHKEREAGHEARLQTLVDEGKLTQAQKDAFTAKMKEIKDRTATMSEEEHQKAHETHRTEMDAWFAEQGIDKRLLKSGSYHSGNYHHAK